MFQILLTNIATSGIQSARLTVDGDINVNLSAPPGSFASSQFALSNTLSLSFSVKVESELGEVRVFASEIPNDAALYVQAIDKALYIGNIVHSQAHPLLATACQLRCSDRDPAVNGPTCINCPPGGGRVRFILCC